MQATATTQSLTQVSSVQSTAKLAAPFELSTEMLEQVSGAGPRGGWIVEPPPAAESLSIEAPGPRGGW